MPSLTQGDLTVLLTEVKNQLDQIDMPVAGVISEGKETIGSAVAFVFPKVPQGLPLILPRFGRVSKAEIYSIK